MRGCPNMCRFCQAGHVRLPVRCRRVEEIMAAAEKAIEQAVAKQITGFVRDAKFKVTTQIQGDAIRVTSKSRDDLQAVIAAVRGHEFPVAVSFQNFRD